MPPADPDRQPPNRSVGRRMAVWLLGISLVIILIQAGVQIRLEYRHDRQEVDAVVANLHNSMEALIRESLWITNDEMVLNALKGITSVPYVDQAAVTKPDGTVISVGDVRAAATLVHEHAIVKTYRGRDVHLGQLHVVANLDLVSRQLVERSLLRLATQALMPLILAVAAMWLFHRLVGRHLGRMAVYSQALSIDALDRPLTLDRPGTDAADELGRLAFALDDMRRKLDASLASLKESEAQYRLLFENMAQGVLFQRADGVLTDANPSIQTMFGLTRDQILGKTSLDPQWRVVNEDGSPLPGDRHPSMVALRTGQAVHNAVAGVFNPVRQDYVWLAIHAIPQFRPGEAEPWQVFITFHDITERKQLEAQLRRTQRLESVGTLAGGIAHDFNNLLYPIVGMAEMLMEDHPPGSETHASAEEILKAALRGSDLIKQILAFSRQSRPERMNLRLQPVLKEALKLGRETIPAEIDIVQAIDAGCGAVMADATQIHQIVLNLLTNAFHAVEAGGGQISVALKPVPPAPDAEHAAPGGYARLTVSDTGSGIDPSALERIFEPYFTTKAQGRGSGLGLAVVYGIVEEMGGQVRVSSRVGKGTVVEIDLPLAGPSIEPPPTAPAEAVAGGTERILVVDDEAPVARLEQQILSRAGYRVTAFTSSREALAAVGADPAGFDLVLTDMSMPELAGDRLAERIRALRPDLPVILCTGYSDRVDAAQARVLGIRDLLMKPVAKADLTRKVRAVLDGD